MNEFVLLTPTEMVDIDAGRWGWVGLVQPLYDFGRGIIAGMKSQF